MAKINIVSPMLQTAENSQAEAREPWAVAVTALAAEEGVYIPSGGGPDEGAKLASFIGRLERPLFAFVENDLGFMVRGDLLRPAKRGNHVLIALAKDEFSPAGDFTAPVAGYLVLRVD